MGFVDEELEQLKGKLKEIPFIEIISCHPSMVQIRVRHTEYKQLIIFAQFPAGYPGEILLVELKGKTIPDKLIDGLVKVCEQELRKHIGQQQVAVLVKFISDFITSNAFIVCSDELSFIKKELYRDGDELKVKNKAGTVHYKAYEGRYFMDILLTVPNEYPEEHVKMEIKATNFPPDFMVVFTGHASELSRQCVQPPIRKKASDPPFQPKPSLQLIANYLVADCTRKYPQEKCALCNRNTLPEDPKDIITDETHDNFIYRVYCSHMYHRSCLEVYMKTPPFEGGKKCPRCRQRIFHDKWNVHPKLAEDRWAHQEARKREVAEVADFLGF